MYPFKADWVGELVMLFMWPCCCDVRYGMWELVDDFQEVFDVVASLLE